MAKRRYERPVITKHYSGFMNKFGAQTVADVKYEIDGVSVDNLIEKFGSPLFVMSEKKIIENQKKANRIFKNRYPKVQFAWSYKTNYLNAVCSVFHREGSWAEVVSGFEYDKAIALGVKGENIIFNGPYKTENDLIKAARNNSKIHIDHFDELYKLIELSELHNLTPKVAIRVNMDVGVHPKWERFGFNFENGEAMQAIKRIMSNKKLKLIGLHTHIGTYMMSANAYKMAASKLVSLAKSIKNEYGKIIDYIDMGGGFASKNTLQGQYLPAEQIVPEFDDYADAITSELLEFSNNSDELPLLILETGRALVDDAGYLITTVVATKRLGGGKKAFIIDAGVNLLFTSFWYKHQISPAQDNGIYTEDSVIYGPLCMNIDCIRDNVVLPVFKKDDKIIIHYTGAYEVTQWMQFITLRPNVIMIMEDGSVELIRRSENINDITSLESVPEKLKKLNM